jgi:acetophenone carboxylase
MSAKSRYDEGLLIPPIKIGENYSIREDILNMLAHMVRDPRTLILDIKARLAACRIVQRRILGVVEKKSPEFVIGGLRKIMADATAGAKKKAAMLPDGTFRHPVFIDTVGPEPGLLKVNVEIEKRGEKIKLKLDDTSPMIPDKPLNTYFQGLIGLTMVYFCGWFLYDLPATNALLEILEWEFPEGTFVNASGEVPTGLAPLTQVGFSHGVFQVGARMTYGYDKKRAVASWHNGFGFPYYGGFNQWGEPIADISAEMNATGCGARPDMDGVDLAGSFFATMSDCSDVETTEADRPFLYLFRNLFQNHGAGKFRGGNGMGYALEVHGVPWLFIGTQGHGSKFPAAPGVFGGYASATMAYQALRRWKSELEALRAGSNSLIPTNLMEFLEGGPLGGEKLVFQATSPVAPYGEGDIIFLAGGGGSGYGDALERDPQMVVEDLRLNLATPWQAENVYKVVYDKKTLRVDEEATKRLRDEERARRLELSVSYDEFEASWLMKRPPEGALKYYGTYPHPSEGMNQGRDEQ